MIIIDTKALIFQIRLKFHAFFRFIGCIGKVRYGKNTSHPLKFARIIDHQGTTQGINDRNFK